MSSGRATAVETLRVGTIGLGAINRAHVDGYLSAADTAEIVAVCDTVEAAARKLGRELGATAYTDYRTLLEDDRVDSVDVTLPHSLHYPVVRDALEAESTCSSRSRSRSRQSSVAS